MFKCQATGRVSQPGEKPYRVVIETRPRTYEHRVKDEDENRWTTYTTEGFEIVRELVVCKEYYDTVKLTDALAPKA